MSDTKAKNPELGLRAQLDGLNADHPEYAVQFVELLLHWCAAQGASDLHLQPTALGLRVACRLDGVLQTIGEYPNHGSTDPVARLKVLAGLLTYRQDIPQEGRMRRDEGLDLRVSTFPTLYGERGVVRLLGAAAYGWDLHQLGYPEDVDRRWRALLSHTAGALLVTGPAGSGKTTSCYASLREIARQSHDGRSLLSLEDPIEAPMEGVAQAQVHEAAGFTLATGLRSLLRQDPEVIFVGEIRDAGSAGIAMQAALSGQLVISTFHSDSAAAAWNRLQDLGVPTYVLRGAIRGIVSQRLVRKLCDCSSAANPQDETFGLPVKQHRVAVGCKACHFTGYVGRLPIAELLEPALAGWHNLADESSPAALREVALERGLVTRWQRALELIDNGQTSCQEVRRVLGFETGKQNGTGES